MEQFRYGVSKAGLHGTNLLTQTVASWQWANFTEDERGNKRTSDWSCAATLAWALRNLSSCWYRRLTSTSFVRSASGFSTLRVRR